MQPKLRYKIQVISELAKPGATKVFLDGHICEIIFTFGVFRLNGETINASGIRAPIVLNFPPVYDGKGIMQPYEQEIYLECVPTAGTVPQIIVKQIYQD